MSFTDGSSNVSKAASILSSADMSSFRGSSQDQLSLGSSGRSMTNNSDLGSSRCSRRRGWSGRSAKSDGRRGRNSRFQVSRNTSRKTNQSSVQPSTPSYTLSDMKPSHGGSSARSAHTNSYVDAPKGSSRRTLATITEASSGDNTPKYEYCEYDGAKFSPMVAAETSDRTSNSHKPDWQHSNHKPELADSHHKPSTVTDSHKPSIWDTYSHKSDSAIRDHKPSQTGGSRLGSLYSSMATKASRSQAAIDDLLSSISPSKLVAASLLGGMAINSAVQPGSQAGHVISLSGYDSVGGISEVAPVGLGGGYSTGMSSGPRGTSVVSYTGEEEGSRFPLTNSVYQYAQHIHDAGTDLQEQKWASW